MKEVRGEAWNGRNKVYLFDEVVINNLTRSETIQLLKSVRQTYAFYDDMMSRGTDTILQLDSDKRDVYGEQIKVLVHDVLADKWVWANSIRYSLDLFHNEYVKLVRDRKLEELV